MVAVFLLGRLEMEQETPHICEHPEGTSHIGIIL